MRFTTILTMAMTMTLATAAPAAPETPLGLKTLLALKTRDTCVLESASVASALDCLVGWVYPPYALAIPILDNENDDDVVNDVDVEPEIELSSSLLDYMWY
ncbi:hypothetical protein BDW74DRAFT_181991 [Aspergillus multicolor]|uniref:uncharacterized protein n=1 Tax=Aspergillus multicolor TaxID=41759 RepID=UPI003CCD6B27